MSAKNKIFIARAILIIGAIIALSSMYELNHLNSIVSNFGGRFMYSDQLDDATYRLALSVMAVAGALYWLKKIGKPDAISTSTHVKCPDCAELVKSEANVCKHCGARLDSTKNMNLVASMPQGKGLFEKLRDIDSELDKRVTKKQKMILAIGLLVMFVAMTYQEQISNVFNGLFASNAKEALIMASLKELPIAVAGKYSNNYEKSDRCKTDDKFLTAIEPKRVLGYEARCDITSIGLGKDGRYAVDELCRLEGQELQRTQMLEAVGKDLIIDTEMYTRCK